MSKRIVIVVLLLAVFVLAVPTVFAQDNVDIYGRALPDGAASYNMQVYRNLCDSARQETSLSSIVTVYSRICDTGAFDKFSDSLVVLNNNMEIIPSAATSWSVSEDGLTWTFNLRGDQMWSDGTSVTANDWVESWRFMADPDHGYDFVWLWLGIIDGWDEAVAGEISLDEIGLEAIDDNTLAVTTQVPFPPLPSTFFFWPPMQAKALTEIGPDYVLDPETHVSAGPFILKEFEPGSHAVLEANPDYVGPAQAMAAPFGVRLWRQAQQQFPGISGSSDRSGWPALAQSCGLRRDLRRSGHVGKLPSACWRFPHRLSADGHVHRALR